jgi:hypothetical protein
MIAYPNYYKKIILVCYPSNAGGNFLINCLSLNDQSVFRDSILAQRQLAGEFDYKQKIQYLHQRLDDVKHTGVWDDLQLGCQQLFGVDNNAYLQLYHEVLKFKFNTVIQDIMDQDLYLYLVCHDFTMLRACLQFWPNARTIMFVNFLDFVKQRKNNSNTKDSENRHRYWNTVRDRSWPIEPPATQEEFDQLDSAIRQELAQDLKFEISRWFDRSELTNKLYHNNAVAFGQEFKETCYMWNTTEAYSNSAEFLKHFELCRAWVDVPAPKDQDLVDYFENWAQIISN